MVKHTSWVPLLNPSCCTWSLCRDSPADDGYLGRGTVNNRVSLLRRFVEVQPLSYEFFLFFLFFYFLFTLYIGFYFMDCVLSKGKGQLSNVKCVM